MKRIIIFIILIGISSLAWSQPEDQKGKEPDINTFMDVDQEPTPLNIGEIRQAIGYPEEAREKEVSGYVVARILVSEEGDYVKHKIIRQADSTLGSAVEVHLPNLKFDPAIKDGKAIKYWVNLPFNFQLNAPSEESQYKAAIEDFTKRIEADPENYELYVKRGVQHQNIEDHENAILDFEKSLSLNPKKNKKKTTAYPYVYYAHLGLGKSHMALSKWEEAEGHFSKAIEVEEASKNRDSAMVATVSGVYINRGLTHVKMEQYDQANADYDWAIQNVEEDRCLVYSLKYDLELTRENYANVVSCLDEIIQCEPENHTLFFNRGYYKIETEDYEGALSDFDRAMENSQNYLLRIAALNRKAMCYKNLKQFDKALDEVEKARQINVLHPQAYFYKGMILLDSGEKEKACESIKKAIDFGLEGEDKEKADNILVHNCE